MRDKAIHRVQQYVNRSNGKDTRAKFPLRTCVIKERFSFDRAFWLKKIVPHYQDDVNVVGVGLSSDITAKDNEAFEFASALSEFEYAQQARGHKLALRSSVPKTGDHFIERSLMDADRQVSITIEFGKRHSFVRLDYGRAFGNGQCPARVLSRFARACREKWP